MGQDYQSIADQIDAIGRNVSTFYEPVVADMHQVRMQARQFEKLTAELKAASDPGSHEPEHREEVTIVDAAARLRDAIGKAHDTISDDGLRSIPGKMNSHCDQLVRYSNELNSLSFLMLVTTASAAASGFSVEHLVGELREMARQLKKASSDISGTLALIDDVRKDAGKTLGDTVRLIDQSLGQLETSPDAARDFAGKTPESRTPQQIADTLSRDLSELLPGLVACMQHPDAFAQRCDHMARATRLLSGDITQDTDAALRKLIAAQIEDICLELNRIQSDALGTLERISHKGEDTSEQFRTHLANDTRLEAIAHQRDTVSGTSKKLSNINAVSQKALADLLECVKQFEGVDTIFRHLDQMRRGVRASSLNADLSERQAKINMPELRSVTKAVGECALSCGITIDALGKLYAQIHTSFGKVNDVSISEAISVVESVLATTRADLDTLSEQVEIIRSATQACSEVLRQLTELGRSAHARIASNVMAVKQLQQISAELYAGDRQSALNPERVDRTVIDLVFDSYSIETERIVHREALPELSSDAKDESAPEGEDEDPLAEFLF